MSGEMDDRGINPLRSTHQRARKFFAVNNAAPRGEDSVVSTALECLTTCLT